jgi:hypothetical protein
MLRGLRTCCCRRILQKGRPACLTPIEWDELEASLEEAVDGELEQVDLASGVAGRKKQALSHGRPPGSP